ncbi:MAG: hypothetical protein R3247_04345 [Rhodothermales bacterium]|nr:hypothetical protein [Rhodothermales bacterium]
MASRKKSKQILGVMVTGRSVHAALLEDGPEGLRVVRRFTRQRSTRQGPSPTALPEMQPSDDPTDFSVQFTDTGGSSLENMFLGSEFGGIEGGGFDLEGERTATVTSFAVELGDILSEIAEAGLPEPTLAFCAAAAEINQTELIVLGKGGGDPDKKRKKKATASRSTLLELLTVQHKGEVAEECVAFLPMTPSEEGAPRYLAVFPKAQDPVASTIRTMREQQGRRIPSIRLMDTEVALYLGLTRAALGLGAAPAEAEGPQHTLVVRAGAEDTLVLFLEDGVLRQSENLRSLTAYEAPETICSRVLLLQDEYGISEMQNVLLLSEEREDDLVESFEMFFPDARVESMRQYVPELDDEAAGEVSAGALLPAVGVALRLSDDERYRKVFEDVNLLPKQLLRRRINIPVTWHVLAIYALLFCTALFFMARYFTFENRIDEMHQRIRAAEVEATDIDVDAKVLQARIDSLQGVHSQYMRSLNVLEGLLKGSDKWSRALEKTSRQVSTVTGIWIENWSPRQSGIELAGTATTRDQVVLLADRLGGEIATLTFSEIREWPVYSFTMRVPLPDELPEAARFLRERVAEAERQAAEQIPIAPTSTP